MQPLDLMLAVALPLAAGCGLLAAAGVRPAMDRFAWLGWSLMTGFLATACLLWIALSFEWPLTRGWMRLTLGAIAALGAGVAFARRGSPGRGPASPSGARGSALGSAAMAAWVVLALGSAVDSVVEKMERPAMVDDEAINWAVKGKQLFLAGGFNDELAAELRYSAKMPPARAWHPDYPNLVPCLHLWSYVNAGRILHFDGRIPVMAFRFALVLALAGAILRRFSGPLAGALLLPGTHYLFRRDLGADVVVAFGFLVTVDALCRFLDTRDRRWWRLSALGAAVLLGSKHDGRIMMLATLVGAAIAVTRSWKDRPRVTFDWLWLAAPAGALASTLWFNGRHGLSVGVLESRSDGMTFAARLVANFGERGAHLAQRTWEALAGSGLDSRFLHLGLLVLTAASPGIAASRRMAPLSTALFLNWAGILAIFLGTPYFFGWFVDVAFLRVMDQWSPSIATWMACFAREIAAGGTTAAGILPAFRRGAGPSLRAGVLAACALAGAAGPLADLAGSRLFDRIGPALRDLGAPESARMRRFLEGNQSYPLYRALLEHSPESRPVLFVVPLKPEALETWARFSSLLYPKPVVPWVPESHYIPEGLLRGVAIDYENDLAAVLRLTGPEFDVVMEPGTEPPPGIEVEPLASAWWFVLARARTAESRPR